MNVELISGSPDPEELVCRAARNDYRADGLIGHSFGEIMGDIDANVDVGTQHTSRTVHTESQMRTLIDHLIDHGHWGPFEHPQAVVAIEGVTRVVTHQIVRHRHFSYDQQSLRYVGVEDTDSIDETFHVPEFSEIEVDREGVHQIENPDGVEAEFRDSYEHAIEHYRRLLDRDVPKEIARKVLPMGIKTNIVMSGNARAWMHVLNVRTKANVQGETRECADAIFDELAEWMPYTFQKYDDEVLPLKLNP